ncbi:unnamed protein product [Cyprideis torosa]|uniref:Uncharacterized protein n=1 Tax=Cyprideis torosa TaxID=163714 RepID=A0A7R8W116_9CRUS|nr:unnamed protein product [Cyprideis torosa]CAG0880221.1 unnamed protein product [Cyprideis torosa]
MHSATLVLLACVAYATASHPPPPYGSYQQQPKYGYCDPKAVPHCAAGNDNATSWCLEDADYPLYEIKAAISQDPLFAKKYSDLPKQSADDLVDDLTAAAEEKFNYDFYTGQSKGKSPYDGSHWIGPEGYNCPSDVDYIMPKRARNVAGEWRVIVNEVQYYTQTLRTESCLYPDAACRLVPVCIKNKCTQKYVYQRLLSFDPCDPYKGLFIDIFRFPSACNCQIQG